MNTTEKAVYVQHLNTYMETNKVYQIFEDLYKNLIMDQPSEPLRYLIDKLKTGGSKLTRETNIHSRTTRLEHETADVAT